MDPNNPVVKLLLKGLRVGAEGKETDAFTYFKRAWKMRKDNFDACISAHFIAKHQKSAERALSWNLKALQYADRVNRERVKDFYPSLFINIADAYEKIRNKKEARHFYNLAASTVTKTSPGSHGTLLLESIKNGQLRTG